MVRAAAKNHPSVAVVVSPDALRRRARRPYAPAASPSPSARRWRSRRSVTPRPTTSQVASWMGSALEAAADDANFPSWVGGTWERVAVLRYGENPHQRAASYVSGGGRPGLVTAKQLHGKEMSYNNYVDADAAWRAAWDYEEPAAAIIKHANPCGIAVGDGRADAHGKAHDCDPVSAFGGVIAVNRPVSVAMAERVADIFTEVVVAPGYDDGAVEILARKPSVRLLECPAAPPGRGPAPRDLRRDAAPAGRPRGRPRRRPERLDAGLRGGRRRGDARRPGVRLAGLPRGEVQRDRARARRRHGRCRHGSGQPGRLRPARRGAGGRGPRQGSRSPRRTRSSRSPTGSRCSPRPG